MLYKRERSIDMPYTQRTKNLHVLYIKSRTCAKRKGTYRMYALFKTRVKKKRAFTWTYIDHTVVVSANIFPCRARTVRRFSLSPSLIVRQEVGEGGGEGGRHPEAAAHRLSRDQEAEKKSAIIIWVLTHFRLCRPTQGLPLCSGRFC